MSTQKNSSFKIPSPYELQQKGHTPRVVQLLTSPPKEEETILEQQSRDMALFLLEQGFGHAIVDTLSQPEKVRELLNRLLGLRK